MKGAVNQPIFTGKQSSGGFVMGVGKRGKPRKKSKAQLRKFRDLDINEMYREPKPEMKPLGDVGKW